MRSTTCSPERPRRARSAASALVAALVLGGAGFAHDFWIEASSFRPDPGALVSLRFLVGERLEGSELPRRAERIVRFVDRGPGGTADVLGRDGDQPAGLLRPVEPGLHTILYEGLPSAIELEAPRFEAYLREEGLERVIEARAAAGRSQEPGRERYARCAKSLLRVGGAPAGSLMETLAAPLGATLELVCEDDPFAPQAASDAAPARFRLLFRGAPLEGALVVALCRPQGAAQGIESDRARSDADGRVRLRLGAGGLVLVKAVHMIAADDGDAQADWQSYWASLAFERVAAAKD